MAQQEEPLYDFPEPTQPSKQKLLGLQRGRGSLRSISVLDRLLLTVPVWLQLSINPATALHILQREPPGTFLVRKSRTSQRNVLCIRLADDSVPSFVQQFGIMEEQSTLTLETSAISFPDLPRLISFYCVSRDVLPFPLELPEAIAKATSHKELESISHMGIEFWSSHLNVRGPREAPKSQNDKEKKPDAVTSVTPAAAPTTSSDSTTQPTSGQQLTTEPESDTNTQRSGSEPTLFHEFCPITTRSPRELDCGSGLGALCFINPLFLQSQNVLSRRHLFKRSLKVRISTESSTLLSPPLAPPPPPPLMPKTKRRCKAQKQGNEDAKLSKDLNPLQDENQDTSSDVQTLTQRQDAPNEAQILPPSAAPHDQSEVQDQVQGQVDLEEATRLPKIMEHLPEDSEYMQPSPVINSSIPRSLSPYLSPAVAPMAPPPNPTGSSPLFPPSSPGALPSLSPYQSPCISPRLPFSLSPHDSPSASPSLSPYQSPSVSPKVPFSLSPHDSPSASPSQSPSVSPKLPLFLAPFTSSPLPQPIEQAYDIPALPSKSDQQRSQRDVEEEEGGTVGKKEDEDGETNLKEEEESIVLQIKRTCLNDTDSSSSFSSLEGAAETPPPSPHDKTVTK